MLHPERRAYYELAERLGMGVQEMLDRLSSAEITEWFALWKVRSVEAEQEAAKAKSRSKR